jgi:hypothetical protein
MKLVSDNTERMDNIALLLKVAFWDTAAAPIPDDMKALLLAMDLDNIDADMEAAHRMMTSKPAELHCVTQP